MDTEGNEPGEATSTRPEPRSTRQWARPGRPAAQVRGVLAERVVVSTALDPFLSLRALAGYAGLSVRTLREYLDQPTRPLPHYRVGGKILVVAPSSMPGSSPTAARASPTSPAS